MQYQYTNACEFNECVMYTKEGTLIHRDFSYRIAGLLFTTHNTLGRYCREKQYGNFIETVLKQERIQYVREYPLGRTGNIVDFIVKSENDEYILIELKAKTILTKEDYMQTQRYLQCINIPLAILVNFRQTYLKPHRIIKIERQSRKHSIR